MEDRIAQKPGRYMITPDDEASMPFYATLTPADSATVQGTPLDKETLLSDMVADALNLDRKTATPTQAFMALVQYIDRTRPRKDILFAGNVKGPNGKTRALQLSGRMEDYDVLVFRVYSSGFSAEDEATLYPAPGNGGLHVARCNFPGSSRASFSGWTIWHKFPSGFFAMNVPRDDTFDSLPQYGGGPNYNLFDPSVPETVERLKFRGNHVYLAGTASAMTEVEVVGYKLGIGGAL